MKFSLLIVLSLALSFSVFAQVSQQVSTNPSVTVLDKKWGVKKNRPIRPIFDDPEGISQPAQNKLEDLKANQTQQRADERRANVGLSTPPRRVYDPIMARSSSNPLFVYVPSGLDTFYYEITVRNDSTKTIKEITWEYAFSDPATKQELNRLKMVNEETISPGKTKKITAKFLTPPTKTIAADAANNPILDQYAEQIVIKSITYSDGTIWKAQ